MSPQPFPKATIILQYLISIRSNSGKQYTHEDKCVIPYRDRLVLL
jgi:hypothetical protein